MCIKDEYDTQAICEQIIRSHRVMIRADLAGCGKSYIWEYLEQMGCSVLFVVPTNVLVQKYENSTTLHISFGFGVTDDMKLNKLDDSSFEK